MKSASMKLVLAFLFVLPMASLNVALAKDSKKVETGATKKTIKEKRNKSEIGTQHRFEGAMVNGKYQTAGDAVSVVETEKQMNELIGSRRDFKDRLAEERNRLQKSVVKGQ